VDQTETVFGSLLQKRTITASPSSTTGSDWTRSN